MKLLYLFIPLILFFTACSTARMAEQRLPDRQKYSFASPSTGTTNVYLCKKSASGKVETDKRAKAAHQYVSKRISEVSSKALGKMFEKDKFSIFSAMRASTAINRGAGEVAKEVEEKFQCSLIEAKD